MESLQISLLWISFIFLTLLNTRLVSAGRPEWIATDLWDRCSPHCGAGIQHQIFACVESDKYNCSRAKPDRYCGPLPVKMFSDAVRQCDWGDCERKTWWRASNWSECSHPCGNLGFATREVQCVMSGEEDEIVISQKHENGFCDLRKKPESRGPCNRFNCTGEFQPLEWQKCEQANPCSAGVQRRHLSCRSLTLSGEYVELPKVACYNRFKPPPSVWRRCFVPGESAKCNKKPPIIEEMKMVVVQMRAVRRMRLQVGQEAYILPGTRLSIKCPVEFFPSANLIWYHKKIGNISYSGHSANDPVSRFMSKSGNLVIRRFSRPDEGEWRCQAGQNGPQASIKLHYNLPSQGLTDWETRNPKRNSDMQNEDPAIVMTRQKLVQWVEGPWSNCSVPCGGHGIQTRVVRCELLDTGVYHILNDDECKRQFLVKPKTQRVCLNLPKCPTWKLRNADYTRCSNNCIGVGRGTYSGNMACMLGGVAIPEHHCEQMTKPDISCENPLCEAKWSVSNWSPCSVTCGGTGFQYREQKCVWVHSNKPAGSACYDAKIEAPPAVKKCQAPSCRTKCIDLSDQCSKFKHWCSFHTFKYNCCKTCLDYSLELNGSAS